jgi:ATP-dependent DNA helicase RecQ
LLHHADDRKLQAFFQGGRYPSAEDLVNGLHALKRLAEEEPAFEEILAISPLKKTRLKVVLSHFTAHGIVSVDRGRHRLLRPDLDTDDLHALARRFEARDAADRDRQARMLAYAETTSCRWKYILDVFGDEAADAIAACGRCDRCLENSAQGTAIAS